MVSRRILETLTYLARNHPLVAKILLQLRLSLPSLQEPENIDQARGKSVMVEGCEIEGKQQEKGYISIMLLLSLLNQPLYLRSIAHLEQVMFFLINVNSFPVFWAYSYCTGCSGFMLTFCALFQLLNLVEVLVDNAESNSPNKSAESTTEQQIPTSDAGMNTESHGAPSGVSVSSSNVVDSSKPTTSGANDECDAQNVLLNLPQAELRLLSSLLAREGYERTSLSLELLLGVTMLVCLLVRAHYFNCFYLSSLLPTMMNLKSVICCLNNFLDYVHIYSEVLISELA